MNPDHKSHAELTDELAKAKSLIAIGGKYRHYKDSSKIYQVKQLGIREEDDAICVIYQAQYGGHLTFIRPLSVWLERVEWNGQTVDRFAKI